MYLMTNPARVSFDPISFLVSNPSLIYITLVPSSPSSPVKVPECLDSKHSQQTFTWFTVYHFLPTLQCGWYRSMCLASLPSLKTVAQLFWTFGLPLIEPAQPPLLLTVSGKQASAIPWMASSDKNGTRLYRKHKSVQDMIHTFQKLTFQERHEGKHIYSKRELSRPEREEQTTLQSSV